MLKMLRPLVSIEALLLLLRMLLFPGCVTAVLGRVNDPLRPPPREDATSDSIARFTCI